MFDSPLRHRGTGIPMLLSDALWARYRTIAAASKRLAAAGLGAAEEVQRTMEGGLLPSVVLVPAMLIAFTNMHEKGVTYVYAG
jgi:hypothetical protein